MTAHRTTSDSTGVRALLPTRRMMGIACAAVVLASALLLGGSVPALATNGPTDPPDPKPDHVWAGCVLDPATVDGIASAIEAGTGSSADVSFVVVYSLSNDNDGQLLGESGFTGPIICTPDTLQVGITAFQKNGTTPLTETSDIPNETDPNFVLGNSVDVLETEEAFIIKYQHRDFEDTLGDIEKRVCHTVDGFVDCFIIFPQPID
jgi:hypothetical protein